MRLLLSKNENHELKVNNRSILWKPMSLLEDRSQETREKGKEPMCVLQMGSDMLNWWHFGGYRIHIAMRTWWGKYSFYTLGDLLREKNSRCRLAKIWIEVELVLVCHWFILCCSDGWHGWEKTVGRSHVAVRVRWCWVWPFSSLSHGW